MKAALLALALLLAACGGPIQVTRQGSTVPWTCKAAPPLPTMTGEGFTRGGVTVKRYPEGTRVIPDGYGVSVTDLGAVTDYIADIEAAFRSCRAVVDAINRMERRP